MLLGDRMLLERSSLVWRYLASLHVRLMRELSVVTPLLSLERAYHFIGAKSSYLCHTEITSNFTIVVKHPVYILQAHEPPRLASLPLQFRLARKLGLAIHLLSRTHILVHKYEKFLLMPHCDNIYSTTITIEKTPKAPYMQTNLLGG